MKRQGIFPGESLCLALQLAHFVFPELSQRPRVVFTASGSATATVCGAYPLYRCTLGGAVGFVSIT